ncbi:hypothetical protein ACFX2I_000057 [Malus domestica]
MDMVLSFPLRAICFRPQGPRSGESEV